VTDRRSRLGSEVFEQLVIMNSAWGPGLYDMAALNVVQVEEVDGRFDFEEMLADDDGCLEWEKEMALGSTELVV